MRHWTSKYLSIERKEMNCVELVEFVLRDYFNIDYRFPQGEGTIFRQSQQIRENLPKYCIKTDNPQDGDLVLMSGTKRRMCHVGLYVKFKGVEHVLHTQDMFLTAVLHRFSDIKNYGFSIDGIYTWQR